MGIPDHLTCLLRNLYASQEATVRPEYETMDWFQIGKGVCQGCIFSPCLFNFYAHRSVGKESTCNAGDPGLIPGSGRFTREGTGYALQYHWASLVAQLVKNLPAMQETWVWSLGWEDPWGRERLPTPEFSGLENSMGSIVHWV